MHGAVAQLGERFNGIEEVGGSNPPSSTNPCEIKNLHPEFHDGATTSQKATRMASTSLAADWNRRGAVQLINVRLRRASSKCNTLTMGKRYPRFQTSATHFAEYILLSQHAIPVLEVGDLINTFHSCSTRLMPRQER